ncbi:SgcJ/EcaC family oxidoreductase [Gelidibacter maritimus]|uniref:SgcJ/EcaC family oxidoreductase n=1 Tax=Gelidibacter maritimus TaxID=2761487 RepID=A0A7W2M2J3_9FLAO|nr:SgcJ/EcaC family oxidoreductase [Gelidibacter maritimus]MBA6151533.1 SgcJ/EcaC family oxidoreductase [Gelidibacter maritimus]
MTTPYQKANIPEEIPLLFTKAWNQYNASFIASLFTKDADFVNVTGLRFRNKERIFKAHDYGLKVIFNHSSMKLISTDVKMLSDDIAIVHARTSISEQTDDITERPLAHPRHQQFTFVAQKTDKHWLCCAAHNTEVIEGMETFKRNEDGSYSTVNYKKYGKNKTDS